MSALSVNWRVVGGALAIACVAGWRWWWTQNEGTVVVESPKGTYRISLNANTDWLSPLPQTGVYAKAEDRNGTLFQGLGLYKLYRDDDVRTARYDRYWVRENVLHLKSNQPLADDCEELVVRNDSKEVARNVVVHTHDVVLLLDFAPAEQVTMPITRRPGDSGYVGARGTLANGQRLVERHRYSQLAARGENAQLKLRESQLTQMKEWP